LGLGLLALVAEPFDVAFYFALEAEALEAEAAHGPVGFLGPGHKWAVDGSGWVNAVVVELDVGVDPRAGEAGAVELAWAHRNHFLIVGNECVCLTGIRKEREDIK